MSIRAIILDIGGVILLEKDHTQRFAWEARLGLPKGQLTRLVLDSEPAGRAASGQVTEPQVWQAVGSRLGLERAQILELQRDFWSSEELDPILVPFIQSLRPRCKIGLLSNAWSDARAIHNARFKFNTWVDMAIYSAEVGLLKPDPRIYQLALAQLEIQADECVFVDDKLVNVQAAQALGMNAIQHKSAQQTINDIKGYLRVQTRD